MDVTEDQLMTARSFTYKVQDNGRLPDVARLDIAALLSQLPGKMVRVEISLYRKRRSDGQNKYYWGVIVPVVTRMLRDFGNEVNEYDTHDYLKTRVMKLGRMMIGPGGEPERVLGSTSEVPLEEWGEKMEMIRSWAASHGTQIPLPGENYEPI
jgi:hypothetical protein